MVKQLAKTFFVSNIFGIEYDIEKDINRFFAEINDKGARVEILGMQQSVMALDPSDTYKTGAFVTILYQIVTEK